MPTINDLAGYAARRFINDTMSAIGAGAIGLGIGMILPTPATLWAALFLIAGIVIHGVAMMRTHSDDVRLGVKRSPWSQTLSWLCWLVLIGLAGLAAYVLPK